jgi:2'-5' RNA ligase
MISPPLIWPGYYDVVILPPAPIRDHALKLSEKLYRMGGEWRLGKRAFHPHISLYHIPVRDKDLDPFLNELQLIVDTAQWGSLETTAFDMPVMMVSKPAWLSSLHHRIVRRTVRFLNRKYAAEKTWSLDRFSGRRLVFARKYLREYGTPMVGMNFRPHITLSGFKGSEPEDPGIHVRRMTFRADRLHVCELGQSHTCHRIVRTIPSPEGRGWCEAPGEG